ncbi:MAG: CYTH domain-containing protein [Candidatus Nitrotoga sp. SPKER]|nr:MAG: CYTH domain-containing protein [Candidatus Nitrotoga sp. SPKER]
MHVARFRHHAVLESMVLGKPFRRKLYNVYFDTPDQDLQRAGVALRLRRMNGSWTQTVKSDGGVEAGLHQRNEWEWPCAARSQNRRRLRPQTSNC